MVDCLLRSGSDDPNTLVVLTEEELVGIDLQSDGWQCYQLPYLASLHCSAITATAHVSNMPQTLWDKMTDAGQRQLSGYSARVCGPAAGSQHNTIVLQPLNKLTCVGQHLQLRAPKKTGGLCWCKVLLPTCLQCFDAVGWAAGRASGLQKNSGGVLAWLSVSSEVQTYVWPS